MACRAFVGMRLAGVTPDATKLVLAGDRDLVTCGVQVFGFAMNRLTNLILRVKDDQLKWCLDTRRAILQHAWDTAETCGSASFHGDTHSVFDAQVACIRKLQAWRQCIDDEPAGDFAEELPSPRSGCKTPENGGSPLDKGRQDPLRQTSHTTVEAATSEVRATPWRASIASDTVRWLTSTEVVWFAGTNRRRYSRGFPGTRTVQRDVRQCTREARVQKGQSEHGSTAVSRARGDASR